MTTVTLPTSAIARQSVALGHRFEGLRDVDEAIRLAGLDWEVELRPATDLLMPIDGVLQPTSIPGRRLVTRSDTHTVLGVVGGRYTPVTNAAVFDMATHLVTAGAVITEAGALDHGRRVFMRLNLPSANLSLPVPGRRLDLIHMDIIIQGSHDGSGNVSAHLDARRLVCTNGMTVSIPGLADTFQIRHTRNAVARLDQAQTVMQTMARYAKEFTALADQLITTRYTSQQFNAYLDRLTGAEPAEGRARTLWQHKREQLSHLYDFASTQDLGRGTQWAALNAVIEYADWHTVTRQSPTVADLDTTRALRLLDGTQRSLKDRALDLLLTA